MVDEHKIWSMQWHQLYHNSQQVGLQTIPERNLAIMQVSLNPRKGIFKPHEMKSAYTVTATDVSFATNPYFPPQLVYNLPLMDDRNNMSLLYCKSY